MPPTAEMDWADEPVPVGQREIAIQAGVKPDTVKKWIARSIGFPDPRWTVGGSLAWDWREVRAWLVATGRLDEVQRFRYRDLGGGKVLMEGRSADDKWEPLVSFVGDWQDGWQAFPRQVLKDTTNDPELVAYRLLRSWEKARLEWTAAHPGELLPDRLVPRRYPAESNEPADGGRD